MVSKQSRSEIRVEKAQLDYAIVSPVQPRDRV